MPKRNIIHESSVIKKRPASIDAGLLILSSITGMNDPVLFLSEEYLNRTSEEIKVLTQFVLKEAAVWLADILRKVAEERERW